MPKPVTILIIDDEAGIRFSLRGILEDEGYNVLEAESGELGLEVLNQNSVDLIFLDIWLPGMDGQQVLEQIRQTHATVPVLMISGHATIEHAVAAIKNGAHDFIEKPLSLEKVLISVARALEFKSLQRENEALRSSLPPQTSSDLLGESAPMQALKQLMGRVAPLDTWVLLTGENGTGKEVAARYIYAHSSRANQPMVAVNCAAIPEDLIESELFGHEKGAFTGAETANTGKFELAHNGTLFLDEIGDMSVKTQAKILRILQEQSFERVGGNKTVKVDVRVIAATNKNLEQAISRGEFREDLYYRLRVFPLQMPPLRERGTDILLMLDHFTKKFHGDYALAPMQFDSSARKILLAYRWPGNVRELRNFVERMLIMYSGQVVTAAMLPAEILAATGKNADNAIANSAYNNTFAAANAGSIGGAGNTGGTTDESSASAYCAGAKANAAELDTGVLPKALCENDFKAARAEFEARYLEEKLKEFDGNISKMAEAIKIERSYLHRKLKALGITE